MAKMYYVHVFSVDMFNIKTEEYELVPEYLYLFEQKHVDRCASMLHKLNTTGYSSSRFSCWT